MAARRKSAEHVKNGLVPVNGVVEANPGYPVQEGDEVLHKTFGRGRLLQLAGHGINRKATIYFPGKGQKTLLLEMAGLVRVEHP